MPSREAECLIGIGKGRGDMFRLLFLCTGNSCRSPLAAALFVRQAGDLPFRATSAGTMERPPSPATAEAIQVGQELGVDLMPHRSRPLSQVDERIDLVIGFERGHVAAAVVEKGIPIEKTFLLLEIVEFLETPASRGGSPEQVARDAVMQAHLKRNADDSFVPSAQIELADPIGQPLDFYRSTAARIDGLVKRLIRGLSSESASLEESGRNLGAQGEVGVGDGLPAGRDIWG